MKTIRDVSVVTKIEEEPRGAMFGFNDESNPNA